MLLLVAVVFTTIFIAELGDKTMLAVILLSARFKSPLAVALAASLALASITFIGAFAGKWVADRVSFDHMHKLAGALFIIMGVVMIVWKK